MARNGRYYEYLKAESKDVLVELRIVNELLDSDAPLNVKWPLLHHWHEVNQIITAVVSKHVLNRDQTREECDTSIQTIEGTFIKIAYFFQPCLALPTLPYIMRPYQSNVANPADALKLDCDLPSIHPYEHMIVAAVAPRSINDHLLSDSSDDSIKRPIVPTPAVVLESDDNTHYSDSKPDLIEEVLSQNSSDASICNSNPLKSKSLYLDSVTTQHVERFNIPTQESVLEVDVTTDEDQMADDFQCYSQLVVSKVSKYTGKESLLNDHEHNLTQVMQSELESLPATPGSFHLDCSSHNNLNATDYLGSSASSSCELESPVMVANTTAKRRRNSAYRTSSKSSHSMYMRPRSSQESQSSGQSTVSSCETELIAQETQLFSVDKEIPSAFASIRDEKHGNTGKKIILLSDKDTDEDCMVGGEIKKFMSSKKGGNIAAVTNQDKIKTTFDESSVEQLEDKSLGRKKTEFKNYNDKRKSVDLFSSSNGCSNIENSPEAKEATKKKYSKTNTKYLSLKLISKNKDVQSTVEMSREVNQRQESPDLISAPQSSQTFKKRAGQTKLQVKEVTQKVNKVGNDGACRSGKINDSNKNKVSRKGGTRSLNIKKRNVVEINDHCSQTSSTDNTDVLSTENLEHECSGEESTFEGKFSKVKRGRPKCSDPNNEFTLGKRKRQKQSQIKTSPTQNSHEQQAQLNDEIKQNEKLEQASSDDKVVVNRDKTSIAKTNSCSKVSTAKRGLPKGSTKLKKITREASLGDLGARKRMVNNNRDPKKVLGNSSESEGTISLLATTNSGSQSDIRKSSRVKSISDAEVSKKYKQQMSGIDSSSEESTRQKHVDSEVLAPKPTNSQRYTMTDLSLNFLEMQFKKSTRYLREIYKGIRPSRRHDRYRLGGQDEESLVFALSASPYSQEQLQMLLQMCSAEFCDTFEARIKYHSYISKVLLPELCTKIFMHRFNMNEEEALTTIDGAFIHIRPEKETGDNGDA